jgi:nucleotide-binding universal stress UspA family protein
MPVLSDGPVLVGLEFSRAGLDALDLAAEMAADRRAGLTVLHAARQARQGQEVLAAAVDRVGARWPGVVVRTEWTSVEPASALLGCSRDCALVIVGHRSGHGTRRARTAAGSVALRVATRASIPVIVHRPTGACIPVQRPVTVGIGAVPDDEPLAFAFAEADRMGVPLVVEHVWSGPADFAPAHADMNRDAAARALSEATRLVDDTVAVWSDKYPDVEVRRALRHGLDPAFALTAASRTARLLVVGSTASAAPLVQALIHRARCPVAVVPCGHRI